MMSNLLIYFDMKKYLFPILILLTCSSCIENAIDSRQEEEDRPLTLESLLTRSSGMVQEDSLTMKYKLQSDVDHLMMSQILYKDSVFILAMKKEEAEFLGISDEMYEKYLNYVMSLNEQ